MNVREYLDNATQKHHLDKEQINSLKWFIVSKLQEENMTVNFSDISIYTITKIQSTYFDKTALLLSQNIPLAHILGTTNFYGLDFVVNKDVLIPRQETEILCENIIKKHKNTSKLKILDLCTGSGCIAITLAKYLPNAKITALDISEKALQIAKQNANKHKVQINFVESNMFNNVREKFDVIVSNPPYIKTENIATLPANVRDFDPKLALDGGNDGLDYYRIITTSAHLHLNDNGIIYLEIGDNQANSILQMLEQHFDNIQTIKDYNNLDRFIIANLRSKL